MDNSVLTNIFKNCLNILRDNEGLTGIKALRTLSYFLTLKLIEPRLGKELDIDSYEYDFSHIEDDMVDKHRKKLLELVRFSNIAKEKEDNIPVNMEYLWNDILSCHPVTRNIFLKGKGFDIQYKSTYKKIINNIATIDLTNTEYDVLGNAYENVIQDIMTGKVLGQFFTQPIIKKMMVKLIGPQIYEDGKIASCGDPAMGTGGFLISYLQEILSQAKTKNIKLDWNYIIQEGIWGKELEPDTYQLAVSNMLISSGQMFDKLERGDSIRTTITKKFDNILANPPFGIKGLKYDDFQSDLKNEYIPIKTDNAVSLFLQAIIYMLKINGKCAVVLPDGQDLFLKTNKTLIAIREYLLKTCDLKEIIYLPPKIFTYTSINTCVFYFVKKKEGTDVLEIKSKIGKTHKETSRDYKFAPTHQTSKVQFYEYNTTDDSKKLLVEVPIEKIINNSYSLNYAEYIKNETDNQYKDGVVVKRLEEVFHITKGSLQSSKNIEGDYTFITASDVNKTHNSFTHDCECVMLVGGAEGSLAKAQYFKGKFIASDLLYILTSKNKDEINYRYVWYYLNFNREVHLLDDTICCGTPKKMISKDRCANIKIPIPSLECQQEIVKYLDFIYEKSNKTSIDKITQLKQLNEFCLNNQKIFGENAFKSIEEICDIDYGTRITKGNNIEGEYPVYGSGNPTFYTNTFNREGYNILIGRFALSSECVRTINEKIFLNDSGLSVKPKTDTLLHKYLGNYLLYNQSIIYNCARGQAQKNLEIDMFKTIKIPIPSLERQREIVEYCEYNNTLIKQLEKEIESNKAQSKLFFTNTLKNTQEKITVKTDIKSQPLEEKCDSDENDKRLEIELSKKLELKRQERKKKKQEQGK